MNPKNYFKLHWKARSIELGDIDVYAGHALIGLKFENVMKDGVERLRLLALSQSFNYTSGKITPKEKEHFPSLKIPSR